MIIDIIYVILFSVVMATIGYIDYKQKLIKNIIVFPGVLMAILFSFFNSIGWQSCLLGGAVGIGYGILFWIISYLRPDKPPIVSMGDYKLFVLIGLIVGWPVALLLIGIAFFITGFYIQIKYVSTNLNRKINKQKQVSVEAGPPFALITIGWLISWLVMYLPVVG